MTVDLSILNKIEMLAGEVGLDCRGRYELPPRPARLKHPPVLHPAIMRLLQDKYPGGLYAHQADALTAFLAGKDGTWSR